MILQATALLALCATAEASYRYDPDGAYLDYSKRPFILKQPPASGGPYRIDPVEGVQEQVNGVFLPSAADDAWHGLREYTHYLKDGRRAHLRRAVQAGNWAARLQSPDGRFLYFFDYVIEPEGGEPLRLTAPWHGAFTQGVTISLFTRLYSATGKRRWLRLARRSLRPLAIGTESGGATSRFLGGDAAWFEGYASLPVHPHTLTHHLHTLIGLYDLSDRSPDARRILGQGMRSLHLALPRYDLGDRSAVWLLHLIDSQRPVRPISGWGQEVMVPTMRALDSVRKDGRLHRYLGKWTRQLRQICRNPAEQCYFH